MLQSVLIRLSFCAILTWVVVSSRHLDKLDRHTVNRFVANETAKSWVILVSGTMGWSNYRYQADVCHAYHLFRDAGIPAENIITMMYDDIAYHPNNPFPGKIFVDYEHVDQYAGVIIDYNATDVNANVFLDMLHAEKRLVKRGKKVLKSGKDDNLFIYIANKGSESKITFPTSSLSTGQVWYFLVALFAQQKYAQMLFYLEGSYAKSVVGEFGPLGMPVLAMAATSDEENSECFCSDPDLDVCLSNCFSNQWIRDSRKHDLNKYTVNDHYASIVNSSLTPKPGLYGHLAIGSKPLGQFFGYNAKLNN